MSTGASYVAAIVDAVAAVQRAEVALEEARAARDLRVASAVKAGLTYEQAARVAGMSYGNVRAIARKRGVEGTLPMGPRRGRRAR